MFITVELRVAGTGRRTGSVHLAHMIGNGSEVRTSCGLRRKVWGRAVTSDRTLAYIDTSLAVTCARCPS